ncbi:hypothetical protein Fcan01_11462 [Folsomia candida]|uniref:Uncharacterized protein n=1 Tax=Folsomia candida TaxID=158441 RepID=A0A226EBM3_FOLCA|nr:hypothetical protein Fcan01_11462 [Folsomia candida]
MIWYYSRIEFCEDFTVSAIQDAGSSPQIYYLPSPLCSPAPSPVSPSLGLGDVDVFKQILEEYVEKTPRLANLILECREKSLVDNSAAAIIVNEFVSKLVDLKGNSPCTRDQISFAKAIVEILPFWKYPGTPDGIDILYDEINRSGLIQQRLKWIHRNIRKPEVDTRRRKKEESQGGPKPKIAKGAEEVFPNLELTAALNSSTKKGEIVSLMKETFEHRNQIRRSNDQSVLRVYSKFAECSYLVNFEFSLMFPDLEQNFLNTWPEFADRLIAHCKTLSNSPALLKFANNNYDNWDKSIAALFVLLHLIPPSAQGRGKGGRCKIDDAKLKLVTFYRAETPLKSIVDTWNFETSQPALIVLGEDHSNLTSFYIICDRILLPINARTSTEAIDSLFKAHYVIGTEYDKNLTGIWKFIQVHIFQLETTTQLSRKVKQVFQQISTYLQTSNSSTN